MLNSYEFPLLSFNIGHFFLGIQLDAWELLNSVLPILSWQVRWGPGLCPTLSKQMLTSEGLSERADTPGLWKPWGWGWVGMYSALSQLGSRKGLNV